MRKRKLREVGMKNRIITISREFGSGGRTIGKKVAEELKIPCYDSELIGKIAKESGFNTEYIKECDEYGSGGYLSFLSNRAFGLNNEDYLWNVQCKIITEIAEKESCVIVGRCADYILRETADIGVISLCSIIEIFACHVDTVFRPLQLGLQFKEVLISLQIRIIFRNC